MSLRRLAMLAALMAVGGCGGAGGGAQEVRALASWAATADLVAEAWIEGTAPRAYSVRTLARVRTALGEHGRDLGHVPAESRLRVAAAVLRLDGAAGELGDAIARRDRARAATARATVAAEARVLRVSAAELEGR